MGFFSWILRRKPKPSLPEPPVLWRQTEREWVWLVTVTERDNYGKILSVFTFPCENAEVAADVQARFCADRERNYSNKIIRQAIIKTADEAI